MGPSCCGAPSRSVPAPRISDCSIRAGPRIGCTTDPWRVLRIQAEFVEGFGALAGLPRAVTVFGSARTKPDNPEYARAHGDRRRPGQGGIRGDHRRRPRNHGGGQPRSEGSGRSVRRPRDRAPVRTGASTNTWTWASTSATSSPARRCSSSTPRPSCACRAGSGPWTSCSRRSPWCRPRRSPSSRSCCSGRRTGVAWSTGSTRRWAGAGNINEPDLALIHVTDDVDDMIRVVHDAHAAWVAAH